MEEKEIFKRGLSEDEAGKLLIKYGPNEIKEKGKSTFLTILLSQFNNFLTILLIIAGVVSFLLGERLDSFFIFLIVILNCLFGLYQEFKAEKALSKLKNLTVSMVRVIRNGQEKLLDSRLLVPGDIFYVEEGTKIPADALLLKSWYLEVNEASLTGESLPVLKKEDDQEKNTLYMGTVVARGRGYAKVLQTGSKTRFGKIAQTLSLIQEEKTPLQKKLEVFTKQIGLIGLLAALTVFVLSFVKTKTLFESFLFAVSLAVAAVPEGLPAVMTITLAIGVERMAKKRSIIRKLNAIETLGSVTLVATDKTGTLTTNRMVVKKIWVNNQIFDPPKVSLNNRTFSQLILDGILCSTASIVFKIDHDDFDVIGDPTEGALLHLAQKKGLIPEMVKKQWRIINEIPFNPVTKRMTVVAKKDKQEFVFTKGAPESILEICQKILIEEKEIPLSQNLRNKIESDFQHFAKKGLRMIAFSFKDKKDKNLESGQTFLGFAGLADPIRPEVKEAVMKAKNAGVKVLMITGDNSLTAEAIGIEAGIIKEGEDIISGEQVEKLSDNELLPLLSKVKIFARITPEHKYRLVKLFQSQNEVVAVTGDGVNDSLALKQADVGIAMGLTGTDVAKETADMIITDDNFATIINAIEEGRNIFNHIKNAIKYLLSCNIGEVVYILLAVIFRLPILVPLQILYINLITDGVPAISLAFSPNDKMIMKRPPRKMMEFLSIGDFKYIAILGFLTAFLAFISITPFLKQNYALTIAFTVITFVQPLILLDLWLSHRSIIKNLSMLKQPVLLIAFFSPFIIHLFILYHPFFQVIFQTKPLTIELFVYCLLIASLVLIPHEYLKRGLSNKFKT